MQQKAVDAERSIYLDEKVTCGLNFVAFINTCLRLSLRIRHLLLDI